MLSRFLYSRLITIHHLGVALLLVSCAHPHSSLSELVSTFRYVDFLPSRCPSLPRHVLTQQADEERYHLLSTRHCVFAVCAAVERGRVCLCCLASQCSFRQGNLQNALHPTRYYDLLSSIVLCYAMLCFAVYCWSEQYCTIRP